MHECTCPHCRTAMTPVEYEGTLVHTCGTCGGEYVGGEALRTIVTTQHQRFDDDVLVQIAGREPVCGVPSDDLDRCVECPACAEPMDPMNYCGNSGVVVDRCDECGGLWMDRGELEKVQAVMEKFSAEARRRMPEAWNRIATERAAAAARAGQRFQHSRFGFINAVIDRVVDAA
jgi:uncharacterized protein